MLMLSNRVCPHCIPDRFLIPRTIQVGNKIYIEYYCQNCGYTEREFMQEVGQWSSNTGSAKDAQYVEIY